MSLVFALTAPIEAEARVGDTTDQMERRMVQPNLGRVFSWRNVEERQRTQMERENPITTVRRFFPEEMSEAVFFKSAERGRLNSENGWRVHVHYFNGRSVVEAYRRVGPGLNEFEVNAILALNRVGGQAWERVARTDAGESVLGYEFQMGEDGLRARVQGNWMVIYLTRFDKLLVENRRKAQEEAALNNEELRKKQAEEAPASVYGF